MAAMRYFCAPAIACLIAVAGMPVFFVDQATAGDMRGLGNGLIERTTRGNRDDFKDRSNYATGNALGGNAGAGAFKNAIDNAGQKLSNQDKLGNFQVNGQTATYPTNGGQVQKNKSGVRCINKSC